ncbi:hypothetical protein GCM10009544_42320 [Streptomyces stramineus]|uniref:Uncharacterized protein n=1 Tax=Streptomyces stramineus TaxID=173861 RepID=A0ABP3KBN5_9ACTN
MVTAVRLLFAGYRGRLAPPTPTATAVRRAARGPGGRAPDPRRHLRARPWGGRPAAPAASAPLPHTRFRTSVADADGQGREAGISMPLPYAGFGPDCSPPTPVARAVRRAACGPGGLRAVPYAGFQAPVPTDADGKTNGLPPSSPRAVPAPGLTTP